ncbi:MAG: hypothetical protein QMD21_03570 [Candidatus Thermoplasmatota archaeon]|nr:hypothetical protein [Candidatus Thermoplasmatota archaeon]
MWSSILDIICAWNLVFALTLLIISIRTYLRAGKAKFLIVSAVFLLFFAKAALASVSLFHTALQTILTANLAVLLDCAILVMLFLAIVKR